MCLDSFGRKVKYKTATGYKILKRDGGGYKTYRDWDGFKPVKLKAKEWVEDPFSPKYFSNYPPGFHVFETIEGVDVFMDTAGWKIASVVVKVECEDVVATGRQFGHRVVVARRIKVVEEV